MSLKKLFKPKSIAVIGASTNPEKIGHQILKNIIDGGYKGDIYPVHPKADEILDLECHSSVTDIKGKVEMAVIVVPAKIVPSIIEECGKKNVKAAIVISSGFSEVGDKGAKLEKELAETAEEAGVRILGPNCQGINNTVQNVCATWPLTTKKGPISIIAQSGTIGAALECWAEEDNIGISKFAMLGNRADIDETKLLEFFSKDRTTDVIALYLEGVKNGRKFFEVAKEASEKKKIVVLKGGRSEKGAEAVLTHTRSLAGEYKVFKSVCKQAGLILVESINELYDVCKGIAGLPKPKGKNTIILTSSGGSGILAADAAEDLDLNLMDLPEKSIKRLKKKLPSECIIQNPIDLTGSATAEMYDEAIKVLARYKDVHSIVIIVGDPMPGISDVIKERFERLTLVPVMLGGGKEEVEEKKKLQEEGIPVFSTPENAMKALSTL
ncbi:hypothetical protein AKJ48_01315 [candidate division MSBL1 archaeon SCGC-AAA261O19]|uniref:acetate--CoA ligase (ADP-forming) n=2 Tax=candidate division MSBL1 TaxID=215777 RepID=A0A133V264_9EURY|nr:hypothetical protein AKJ42_00495 [candidate division MSBL1 archaeon SCGC-AAA261C02]KXB04830.1 hypothetical protein AKJ48_01315 [candidate division MSBL1 archaeon SCGC-AAA261O19]